MPALLEFFLMPIGRISLDHLVMRNGGQGNLAQQILPLDLGLIARLNRPVLSLLLPELRPYSLPKELWQ